MRDVQTTTLKWGKPKMLGKTKSYLAGAILLVFSVGLADVSE